MSSINIVPSDATTAIVLGAMARGRVGLLLAPAHLADSSATQRVGEPDNPEAP
jgi:hypothetical protein